MSLLPAVRICPGSTLSDRARGLATYFAGTRVIFSHFNAQGAGNYGRAPEGARLVEEARARGVEVAAAQHVYTATQSNLGRL